MTKKTNNGFTLIELLVVIAIIGILSSVVLASLNTARGKGSNAAVKANLNNTRVQAEMYYDTNSNYGTAGSGTGVCATGTGLIGAGVAAAASAGGGTGYCNVATAGAAWAAYTALKVSETVGGVVYTAWCVDNSGDSKGITAAQVTTMGAIATACP